MTTTLKDPLQPVLDLVGDLNALQLAVQKIQPVATDVQTALGDFEEVLGAPAEAKSDLKDLDDLLQLIGLAVTGLSDVPGLEFLDALDAPISLLRDGIGDAVDLLGDLDKGLDPVRDVVKKFNDPVQDIAEVATDLEQNMGVWVQQMLLIDDSVQVAQGVALLVEGDFGKEIESIVTVYVDLAQKLESTVKPVVSTLQDVQTGIGKVKAGLSTVTGKLKPVTSIAGTVDAAFDKVKFLKPVLHDIEEALKPIKWALKALDCVIKKVVDPVIHAILKATGLESKVKHLFDDLLGISGIKTAVQDAESFIKSQISAFTQPLDDLISQASSLTGVKSSFIKTLDGALDTTFNQQIEMLGKALGKAPKLSNVDIKAYSTEYDKFWGIAANLLNLLKVNSSSRDAILTINIALGAGNALISANKNAHLDFRAVAPRLSAGDTPPADAVQFWLKIKAYLEALKASTQDVSIITMAGSAISAGDAYFKAQGGDALDSLAQTQTKEGDRPMEQTKTIPNADAASGSGSQTTFQLVLDIVAALFPALQQIVQLIAKHVPKSSQLAFQVATAAVIGGLKTFLEAEKALPDGEYTGVVKTAGKITITLNNTAPPTVAGPSGNITVTPVPPSTVAAADAGFAHQVASALVAAGSQDFCSSWGAVVSFLNTWEAGALQGLPTPLQETFEKIISDFTTTGEVAEKALCPVSPTDRIAA